MAHFARLDENNVVLQITVVSNEDILNGDGQEIEALGVAVCEKVVGPGPWVQTSYNGNFRTRYASIGCTYDYERDAFILPKPYASWILDDDNNWQAPLPKPSEGGPYKWNEKTGNWDLVSESETA